MGLQPADSETAASPEHFGAHHVAGDMSTARWTSVGIAALVAGTPAHRLQVGHADVQDPPYSLFDRKILCELIRGLESPLTSTVYPLLFGIILLVRFRFCHPFANQSGPDNMAFTALELIVSSNGEKYLLSDPHISNKI